MVIGGDGLVVGGGRLLVGERLLVGGRLLFFIFLIVVYTNPKISVL